MFKLNNFDLSNPKFDLKYLNDLEDSFQYEIYFDDSDFNPAKEIALLNFLIVVLRECLEKATEISH